jgi:hypothetical protein
MSINPRQRKNSKKKFAAYILLLGILGAFLYFLNAYFVSKQPLFISPMGQISAGKFSVEKILKKKNISFLEVVLSENFYLVKINNNGQVILSGNKDLEKQISSLQRILNQLTIEGKSFKTIDFRFSEPVLSF